MGMEKQEEKGSPTTNTASESTSGERKEMEKQEKNAANESSGEENKTKVLLRVDKLMKVKNTTNESTTREKRTIIFLHKGKEIRRKIDSVNLSLLPPIIFRSLSVLGLFLCLFFYTVALAKWNYRSYGPAVGLALIFAGYLCAIGNLALSYFLPEVKNREKLKRGVCLGGLVLSSIVTLTAFVVLCWYNVERDREAYLAGLSLTAKLYWPPAAVLLSAGMAMLGFLLDFCFFRKENRLEKAPSVP